MSKLDVLIKLVNLVSEEPENSMPCGSLSISDSLIGKYVIVRSRNEGINFGRLEMADQTGCMLSECQRIHRVISKDKSLSWYEGVAVSGLSGESRISGVVDRKVIIEDYSLTYCSQIAIDSIKGFKVNETTC